MRHCDYEELGKSCHYLVLYSVDGRKILYSNGIVSIITLGYLVDIGSSLLHLLGCRMIYSGNEGTGILLQKRHMKLLHLNSCMQTLALLKPHLHSHGIWAGKLNLAPASQCTLPFPPSWHLSWTDWGKWTQTSALFYMYLGGTCMNGYSWECPSLALGWLKHWPRLGGQRSVL